MTSLAMFAGVLCLYQITLTVAESIGEMFKTDDEQRRRRVEARATLRAREDEWWG